MPLVRVEVRNEYALGAPELYREAKKEDPKEILEGVAVSGLVGVLRQLGDLAEFAAEVFHGLQEEVTITSSRSHKLMARVQRIEAALSPLEKALLAQRSHLHFAYTAGSNWHARIKCEQNHFVYGDVPQFIMDSYENSRDPPCLQLLDRFDPGGPGSCLKRYSDPTFFKRASVASGEATSTEKISRDKKGRKIKDLLKPVQKRRSWPRNGEVSRDTSISYNSGRMRFAQPNIGEQTSPSQTASTYDATTLRSDFGEQSNLDLRNGSGYTDGDSRPSYSVQPDEQDSRESTSSRLKRPSDYLDYNIIEEKITDAYGDIEINLSEEQVGSISSSVTWDEKREAFDFTGQVSGNNGITLENDHNRHLESFSQDLVLETLPDDAVNPVTVGKIDGVHIDDVESETDNFMDALNTIESECEPEIDSIKTREVEHYHKLDDRGVYDELTRHNIESQSSNSEPNVLSNTIESECETDIDCTKANKGVDDAASELRRHNMECQSSNSEPNVLPNSSLVNSGGAHNIAPTTPRSLYATNSSINRLADKDEINAVCLAEKGLQSSQRAGNSPITDRTMNSAESQKQSPETSNVASFTFWTNGGLLGLQPSKPPDFSSSNAPQDDMHNKDAEKQGQTEYFNNITDRDDMDSGPSFRKASWKISPADLDVKFGKLGDSLYHKTANSTDPSVTAASRSFPPIKSEYQSKKKHQDNSRSSSLMSDPFEQKNHINGIFSGRSKEPFVSESPILSPPSSPPLKHMQISFRPIDGFETSKLKLKFPDGNSNNGNGSDIFPSFQLVPEASFTPHNVGSDSDADTFYRSSPSLSDDDCHSNQSGSNSDQWESTESPTSKDRDIYNSFRRISVTESVSTVQENGLQNSESCGSSDVQSLSTVNHSFRKERNDIVEPLFVASPAPPPLPPVQWRGVLPHVDCIEDKPERSYYESFDITHSSSTISQPKPAPLNEDQIDTTNMLKSKQSSSQKSNEQREANHSTSIDENDFLRQIRTKSFNLRRTVTAKPSVPSGSSATVQVTAILEKANAIRQAVGSDGEEDGNWSDT